MWKIKQSVWKIDADFFFVFLILWIIMWFSLAERLVSANELSKCLILIAEGLDFV